jgi:hypothetical protein
MGRREKRWFLRIELNFSAAVWSSDEIKRRTKRDHHRTHKKPTNKLLFCIITNQLQHTEEKKLISDKGLQMVARRAIKN